jgi:hypothetical protein
MQNIKKVLKNKFLVFSIILSLILFTISFYRAKNTGITYDEAYTYMFYAKNFTLKSFSALFSSGTLANNHIINTSFILYPILDFFL